MKSRLNLVLKINDINICLVKRVTLELTKEITLLNHVKPNRTNRFSLVEIMLPISNYKNNNSDLESALKIFVHNYIFSFMNFQLLS